MKKATALNSVENQYSILDKEENRLKVKTYDFFYNNIQVNQLHERGVDAKGDRVTFSIKGLNEVVLGERQKDVD